MRYYFHDYVIFYRQLILSVAIIWGSYLILWGLLKAKIFSREQQKQMSQFKAQEKMWHAIVNIKDGEGLEQGMNNESRAWETTSVQALTKEMGT